VFFVDDVIFGAGVRISGRVYLALSANEPFLGKDFVRKLGCNPGLLRVWSVSSVSGANIMVQTPNVWQINAAQKEKNLVSHNSAEDW